MRRMIAFLFVSAMVFSLCMPCYAAETAGNTKEAAVRDVYVKYIRAASQDTVPVENGSAETITEDGYTVTVTGAPEGAAYLKVISVPSSETEAWEWFKACLGSGIRPFSIFDIYFEDSDGNRIDANGAEVMISCSKENTKVYSVNTDGSTKDLNRTINDGIISFIANGSRYYVLATMTEKEPAPDKEINDNKPEGNVTVKDDSRNQTSLDKPVSPVTGDSSNPGFWVNMVIWAAVWMIWNKRRLKSS